MKKLINAMLVCSAVCFMGCSNDPDDTPLKRDTDLVNVAYKAAATAEFTVRYNGPWEARVECVDEGGTPAENWFTVTPNQGVGNGKEYQYLTVTAQRNAGKARKGYVYLKPSSASEDQERRIEVTQEDGIFSVGKPLIRGELKTTRVSAAQLVIGYDKAFGGEQVEITASLEGVAEGLEIEVSTTGQVEAEGSGEFTVPITGTPENIGDLYCNVVVKIDGKEAFNGPIEFKVQSPSEVFAMDFSLFIWGGDVIKGKPGFTPNPSGGTAGKEYNGTEKEKYECTSGSDGTNDVFATMTDEYRKNRGVVGWSGNGVYERPGYIKLGTGSKGGWIMTPALSGLPSTPTKIVVAFDISRFDGNAKGDLTIALDGPGVIQGGTLITMDVLPAFSKSWTRLSYTVTEATNATKIKIGAADLGSGTSRFLLDNIVVMTEVKPELKEPLATPDISKLQVTATQSSFGLKWEAVKNADLYEVELTDVTRPQFSFKERVEIPEIAIENIASGYYDLKITAVWTDDEKFNSVPATKQIATKGVRTEPLDVPTKLACTNQGYTMTTTWAASEDATGYHAQLWDGATLIEEKDAAATYCDFAGLEGGKTYKLKVKATFKPNPTLDSPYTEAEVKSLPLLTAPTVTLYATSNGFAIVEWELSDKALLEQLVDHNANQTDTYDFRLKSASGTVLRTLENYASFAFKKYKYFRFIFAGLKPSTGYTLEMRRIASSANASQFVNSGWVSVPVTTDAAPSTAGYLLYKDFATIPMGAHGLYCAYGCMYDTKKAADFSDTTDPAKLTIIPTTDKNWIYVQTPPFANSSFHNAYLPEWDQSELSNSAYNSNIFLGPGYLKFGAGSKPAWFSLPRFTTLTTETDLVLELDACPYYEPNATTGDLSNPATATESGHTFYIDVTGSGSIATVDGTPIDAGTATLKNKEYKDMNPDGIGRYEWTSHMLKISGATADTRITIYTAKTNDGKNHRMWMTNLKVRKAD